jgi:flagellar assembly protein FliH
VKDKLTKNPVRPTKEMLDILESWAAPDVTEVKKQEVKGKTNFMGMPVDKLYSQIVEEAKAEEEEIQPLTAEEIEQIRQDAYDEGFAQGKDDGFAKGQEEGLQQGHEQGLQQGHQEGYLAGFEQGQNEVNQLIARWNHLAYQLYHPVEKIDKVVEKQLLNLTVALAESVIRKESEANLDVLLNVLHESVGSLPFNIEYAEIHMHPDDIELLRQVYDDEALIEQKWIIKEEPSYTSGDVVVMTPNSLIDRTIKQRLRQTIDKFIHKAELDKEIDESLLKTPEPTGPNLSQADAEVSLAARQVEMAQEAEAAKAEELQAEVLQEAELEESEPETLPEMPEENVEFSSEDGVQQNEATDSEVVEPQPTEPEEPNKEQE